MPNQTLHRHASTRTDLDPCTLRPTEANIDPGMKPAAKPYPGAGRERLLKPGPNGTLLWPSPYKWQNRGSLFDAFDGLTSNNATRDGGGGEAGCGVLPGLGLPGLAPTQASAAAAAAPCARVPGLGHVAGLTAGREREFGESCARLGVSKTGGAAGAEKFGRRTPGTGRPCGEQRFPEIDVSDSDEEACEGGGGEDVVPDSPRTVAEEEHVGEQNVEPGVVGSLPVRSRPLARAKAFGGGLEGMENPFLGPPRSKKGGEMPAAEYKLPTPPGIALPPRSRSPSPTPPPGGRRRPKRRTSNSSPSDEPLKLPGASNHLTHLAATRAYHMPHIYRSTGSLRPQAPSDSRPTFIMGQTAMRFDVGAAAVPGRGSSSACFVGGGRFRGRRGC